MRIHGTVSLISTIALAIPVLAMGSIALGADANLTVPRQIATIFKANCVRCHGATDPKSGLDLATPTGIVSGGDAGPGIVAGKPDDSPLFVMIRDGEMPPKNEGVLSDGQIETVREWILGLSATSRTITWDEVHPVLLLRCTACHGVQKQEAELDLRSLKTILKGGKSGPAIIPGNPSESLLLRQIETEQMPPRRRLVEASIKVIEPHEIELLRTWVEQGAVDSQRSHAKRDVESGNAEQFWSYVPPRAAPIPRVQQSSRVRNPIDAFVIKRLEEHGVSLSPDADPMRLMRRVYFDLTGLPPTPHEMASFQQQTKKTPEAAYLALIERLLASPRYGERWARFWLDVAGYSDSEGITHQDSPRANSWRYRDYVIRAFNSDKPYDRFLLEQIAGDELADFRNAKVITAEIYDNLVATGFLRQAPDGTWANITNFVPDRLDVIGDEIEILSSATMGLTFKCARCHSHKFDPITHRDYHSLLAILKGAFDEHNWLKPYNATQFSSGPFGVRLLDYVTTDERNQWEADEKSINEQIDQIKAKLKSQKKALAADALKAATSEADRRIKDLQSQRRPQPMIRALWDQGTPSTTYLLRRGNYLTPGKPVEPDVPAFLKRSTSPFLIERPFPDSASTGRRLAFARWLIHEDHPLTARVMINRIWKHHFGHGVVRTLDNFGKTGAPPTHPELLDWLAVEFIRQGWSIKAMHRLILTSSVYRQAAEVSSIHEQADPENRLLTRMPLRRLEAESLRDALLFVSGQLDERRFGPPDAVKIEDNGLVTSVGGPTGWRRSIYVQQRRTQIPTILDNFDLPQMGPNCIERGESTVAPQALHLLNNQMVHELSLAFADRIYLESGPDTDRQVQQVYRTALARNPTTKELKLATDSLERLSQIWRNRLRSAESKVSANAIQEKATRRALANLCHAIMNSASFLYID